MSEPVVFEADKILIKVEMVEGSGTFDHDCLINLNRSVSITASMIEETVYGCPGTEAGDEPGTVYRIKDSVSLSASGTGKTHKTSLGSYLDWILAQGSKRARIEMGGAGGQALLTRLHLSEFVPAEGEPKRYAAANMSFVSDGKITREAL